MRRLRIALAAAGLLLGSSLLVAAVAGAQVAPDTSFWARYSRLVDQLDTDTTAARRQVDAMRQRDPDDALACWAALSRLAPQDSASLAAVAASAGAPETPGASFARACARVRGSSAAGWAEFAIARARYLAAARPAEAARAELLLLVRDSDLRNDDARARRFADAESLAFAARESLDAMAVRLRRAGDRASVDGARVLPSLESLVRVLAPRPPSYLHADAIGWVASVLKNLGRLPESEARYLEARAAAERLGSATLVMRARIGLAGVWKARGDVRAGVDEERAVLALARENGNTLMQSIALTSIGISELALRHLDGAGQALREALVVLQRRGGGYDTRVSALDQLGGVEALSGRPDSAARYFNAALTMARSRGLRNGEAFVLLHLAEFSLDQGRPDEAQRWNDLAIAAARQSGRRRAEEIGLAQGAAILTIAGRAGEAADMAIQAARMTREAEPRNYGNAVGYAVGTLLAANRPAEARALLDSLRAFLAQHPDTLGEAGADRFEARIRLATGDAPGAVAALRRSIAKYEAIDDRDDVARARLDLGAAWLAAGSPDSARAAIELGLPWFEDVLAASESSDDRVSTQSRWQDAYVDLATAYVRSHDSARAFELMDRSRARELRHAFGDRTPAAPAGASPALARDLGDTEEALRVVQGRLLEQYARPPGQRDRETAAWERRADSLRTRWLELHRRAQREVPAVGALAGFAAPLPADSARARLHPGERLLAFFVGDRHALVFDLSRERLVARELPWTRAAIEREVGAWRRELQLGRGDGWRDGARRIADSLLAGLDPPAPGERRWYVVPDAALHAAPFEALLVPSAHGGRTPLLERLEIVYGDAPGTLLAGGAPRDEAPGPAADVAAFGDPALPARGDTATAAPADRGARARASLQLVPLPSTRREVQSLARAYPRARLYLGARADEADFRRELSRAQVLHVASHGFADDRHPEFSGLVLSPHGAGDDGVLQAWELLGQRSSADLVTLSACESGLGRASGGEGLLGLSRAFAMTGARQCIVSLWKVDDAATAELMRAFYAALARGATPAAALREARLALAHRDGAAGSARARGIAVSTEASARAHPAAWAAFVLRASRLR